MPPLVVEEARHADDGVQLEQRERRRGIVEIDLARFDLLLERGGQSVRVHLEAHRERGLRAHSRLRRRRSSRRRWPCAARPSGEMRSSSTRPSRARRTAGLAAGVSPKTALAVGLKVDADALPAALVAADQAGQGQSRRSRRRRWPCSSSIAVVGVKGFFDEQGEHPVDRHPCAFCHSTVDDSFAPGIGKRRGRLGQPRPQRRRDRLARAQPPALHRSARGRRRDGEEGARRAGARAASTPSSTRTARRSVPTGSRRAR